MDEIAKEDDIEGADRIDGYFDPGNQMNRAMRSNAFVVVNHQEAPASAGFAEQQTTVSVDKDVLEEFLTRTAEADPAKLRHVISVVMGALAEYPNELCNTIEAYTGAIVLAASTGEIVELHFSHTPEGEIEATPTVPRAPAITRALARGHKRVAEILADREMLNGRKFSEMIDVSPQTLNEWREQRKVLALSGAKRGFRYPDWQVVDETGELLPGLVELHRILGDRPWSVYRFLRQHHAPLGGRTGIKSLKSGDVDATIATAKGLADTFN